MWPWNQRHEEDEMEDSVMMRAVDSRIRRLLRPSRRLLALVLVGLLASFAGIGIGVWLSQTTTDAIRNNQITGCTDSNAYRAGQTQTWKDYLALQAAETRANAGATAELIALLAKSDPAEIKNINVLLGRAAASNKALEAQFIEKVERRDTGRVCNVVYGKANGS